eukprot:TRINITY_DN112833_c0_g1_i1.p1 TRINITY_DN112833_c0_g1~~TRINITY_DN112833_c0_g1_i1.p1  ORF type:complete len:130 (+),score=14.88 TRINITY_DN112833_c0_g1_i1:100-489(+)
MTSEIVLHPLVEEMPVTQDLQLYHPSQIQTNNELTQTPGPVGRRGSYVRKNSSAKKRIFDAFENGQNWQQVSKMNGVKLNTARTWIEKGGASRKKRGGPKRQKWTNACDAVVESCVDANPLCTLKDMAR